jgi:hypothetical protein
MISTSHIKILMQPVTPYQRSVGITQSKIDVYLQISDLLKTEGTVSCKMLMNKTNCAKSTAVIAMNMAKTSGEIEPIGKGIYVLARIKHNK